MKEWWKRKRAQKAVKGSGMRGYALPWRNEANLKSNPFIKYSRMPPRQRAFMGCGMRGYGIQKIPKSLRYYKVNRIEGGQVYFVPEGSLYNMMLRDNTPRAIDRDGPVKVELTAIPGSVGNI